jgi:uncharacterized protein YcfJ
MNTQAKLIVSTLFLSAMASAGAADFEDYGRVVRVSPRTEQISRPRQECKTDYVQVPVAQPQQERSAGGAIVGGIIGGVLGNQVGGGTGRSVATAAGAIAGAIAGDRADNGNRQQQQPTQVAEQAVRSCRTVNVMETRTVGYDVTYDFRGRNYTSVMSYDPGQRVKLRVTVEPEQ